jgi:hypothetical protein
MSRWISLLAALLYSWLASTRILPKNQAKAIPPPSKSSILIGGKTQQRKNSSKTDEARNPTLRWPHRTPMKHLPLSQPLTGSKPHLRGPRSRCLVSWSRVRKPSKSMQCTVTTQDPGSCFSAVTMIETSPGHDTYTQPTTSAILRTSRMPQPRPSGLRLVVSCPATLQ